MRSHHLGAGSLRTKVVCTRPNEEPSQEVLTSVLCGRLFLFFLFPTRLPNFGVLSTHEYLKVKGCAQVEAVLTCPAHAYTAAAAAAATATTTAEYTGTLEALQLHALRSLTRTPGRVLL